MFDYVEMFYNPKRKHTNNGILSPVDFEYRQQKLNEAGVWETRGTSTDGGETMNRTTLTIVLTLTLALVAGCSMESGGRAVVKGTGSDELLKLRAGPGLGYKVILGLPDGTALTRHSCVTEAGQLWCRVTLAAAPTITGFVSADYIAVP